MKPQTPVRVALALALAFALAAPAAAQVAGGGGGGAFQSIYGWVQQNLIPGLALIAVVVVACMAMAMRMAWLAVGALICGFLIFKYAQTISAFLT